MSKNSIRLPTSQRRDVFKKPVIGRMDRSPGRPRFKAHASQEAAMAAAAIKQAAKSSRVFKRPSEDAVKDLARVAVFNLLGPELPPWSGSVEEAILKRLISELEELADGKYLRAKAVHELLMQTAKKQLHAMEPHLRFQPASDEKVRTIAKASATKRRNSPRIANFNRALNVYCAACLGYTGRGVTETYLFIQLQRRMETVKDGPYVRMHTLYETLESWAEEELRAIEDLLSRVADRQGGGRKLRKWESPRGYEAYEITVRFRRVRKCYLIVDATSGKPYIVALKDAHAFQRNLRRRFNRNAERSFANVPTKLRHRTH